MLILLSLYTAPPSPVHTITVENVQAISIIVCWNPPVLEANSPISYYLIGARNLNSTGGMDDVVVANTTANATLFNVTGLLPGTTYELTVVAVSQQGDVVAKSGPSHPVTATTRVTG